MYFVYILTNKNKIALCISITNNLVRRGIEHKEEFVKFILFYNEEYLQSKLKYQTLNRTYSKKIGYFFSLAGSI